MNSRTLEIGVGLFVAAGLAALFMLAMQVSNLASLGGDADSYTVTAGFENIGGLKVRSPVTVSGVRVGRVSAIDYDTTAYEAVVTLSIDSTYNAFPNDTSASIFTAGLLGEQYIALDPGGAMENLGEGSRIRLTQSALVMEQIIGQFLYSMAAKNEEKTSEE
ncbi:MAG: outer membrane lipid asymmetry maintenance protein MlaD [Gammaproteobacteria bacterium]|nr:outer membrane lipid asymmetry maintenance protein MlaD [Gammaproteobacteria bacterium]MDH5513681.1 outer membrane lipid asymmetry maintenance protein MlaD [Gammaproteobacteria bacterium]